MKFSILWLGLSLLATKVLASLRASPFEGVFLYYVYRIDTISRGGVHAIGRDCPGTGPGGICYFDEFLKHIQSRGEPWLGRTEVGHDLDPDVRYAVVQLDSNGFNLNYDATKIYPEKWGAMATPPYMTIMQTLVDSVYDNVQRDAATNALRTQAEKVLKAFTLVFEARTADMTYYLRRGVDDRLRRLNPDWKCEIFTKTLPGGYLISMVDARATIAANPGMEGKLPAEIQAYIENYANVENQVDKGRSHYRILQSLQLNQQLLEFSCT